MKFLFAILFTFLFVATTVADEYTRSGFKESPYHFQINKELARLKSNDVRIRAGAIENLSFLRSFDSAEIVLNYLQDKDASVRREAAMNLGWTGNQNVLFPLTLALKDVDWTVRQAAAVALENLTGQQFSFDGLAKETIRLGQTSAWKDWVVSLDEVDFQKQLTKIISSDKSSFKEKENAMRTVGMFAYSNCASALVNQIKPFVEKQIVDKLTKDLLYTPELPNVENRAEKYMVQAGIRALGRLGNEECLDILIELLSNPQWAVYAAEALGDVGGEKAAKALIANFPDYCIGLSRPQLEYGKMHSSDKPHLLGLDRIPRAAHMILMSLSRIQFSSTENLMALRSISPYILSNMPNVFDGTVVYEKQSYQMIAGYLLEKVGVREYVVDAAFEALKTGTRKIPKSFELRKQFLKLANDYLDAERSKDPPYVGTFLMSCCKDKKDIPALIELLEHENGWIRIDAARTLIFLEAEEAIEPVIKLLQEAKDDADYGFSTEYYRFISEDIGQGYSQYNDPSPRFKEAYLMLLGKLKAVQSVPMLIELLNNDKNVIEVQYTAMLSLGEIGTPEALEALRDAEASHPIHLIKVFSRELLWQNQISPREQKSLSAKKMLIQLPVPTGDPKEIVFIKGPHEINHQFQISKDISGYSTTDSGPVYRIGSNIFKISTNDPEGSLQQLTFFKEGYVADLEVSYDGKRMLFSRRGPDNDPWWHVFEMNADGSNIHQLTFGPYHNVHPNYLPDGRIVFSSSRMGTRDEYHGYPACGISVMNADGSDFHVIGMNLGLDAEPVVADDGKILFSRLELFYSRVKTEWNLLSMLPDGTTPITLYGPESRELWTTIGGAEATVTPRHRILRPTQPQIWNSKQYLINSFRGPMLVGPGRYQEEFLRPDNSWAVATSYKISDQKLLVAAGKRPMKKVKGKKQLDIMASVDHGIYYMDRESGDLKLIYNDPLTADFEARALQARKVPPIRPEKPDSRSSNFTGKIYCNSVFNTQHNFVKKYGRYIRIVEGLPTVARHQTHKDGGIAWRNHGGAVGRILGIVPLAADGSFALEIPADHLFHLQVLDSDKRVLSNELIWQHARPGENKSCIGCHQKPDETPRMTHGFPAAHRQQAVKCLPYGNEMRYRGKVWFKGWVPDEREERMRTVNAINLIGRQ